MYLGKCCLVGDVLHTDQKSSGSQLGEIWLLRTATRMPRPRAAQSGPEDALAQEETEDLRESNTCQVSLRSWRHTKHAKPSALTANLRRPVLPGTARLHKETQGARTQQILLSCLRQQRHPRLPPQIEVGGGLNRRKRERERETCSKYISLSSL